LEKIQQDLEDEVRGFTFDLQSTWEKQDAASAQLLTTGNQLALRSAYRDLVAWRTMVGQHCTAARIQLETGDAPGVVEADEYGLGATVAKNPLKNITSCAVEDARAFTVEKFGVAPEVEIDILGDEEELFALCLGPRVHYCVLEVMP